MYFYSCQVIKLIQVNSLDFNLMNIAPTYLLKFYSKISILVLVVTVNANKTHLTVLMLEVSSLIITHT